MAIQWDKNSVERPAGDLARDAIDLWWRLLTCRFRGHPRYDEPFEYQGRWYYLCGCGKRSYGKAH